MRQWQPPRACWRSRPTPERGVVRRAGEAELPDGARLTWSCADGSRGRRWRAVSILDGAITHAVLLEVDLAGRPARLELTTAEGMLTLHPSADETQLHGNIVRSGGWGVKPLTLRWDPQREIDVVGRPLAIAVGLHRRRDQTPVGETIEVDVVAIRPDLGITTTTRRIRREGVGTWRVLPRVGFLEAQISMDSDGLPANGSTWALEPD